MSGHTPEPEIDLFRCSVTAHSHEFRLMKDDVIVAVLTDEHGGTYVEDGQIATSINEQYGLRFLAAWNACAGIPTEALEADVVRRMRDSLAGFQRDHCSQCCTPVGDGFWEHTEECTEANAILRATLKELT